MVSPEDARPGASATDAKTESTSDSDADFLSTLLASATLEAPPRDKPPSPMQSAVAEEVVETTATPKAACRVGLVHSPELERHAGPPGHPETPQRHQCIVERFTEAGLVDRCVALKPCSVSDSQARRAHGQAHLDELSALYDADGPTVQGKGDLFWNAHTDKAARLSAGCAVVAVTAVARGEVDSAFAVIRPPGHHAECDRAMGFCFLNNASIAALAALDECSETVHRVAIIDWDVHHGNGIEQIHYEDPRVLYISLHRYSVNPATWFYPGTGALDDCGKGAGEGKNVNIPWPEGGFGDADYAAAFQMVVEPVLRSFSPNLIIISAGFDAARGDPLGGMNLSPDAYHRFTSALVAIQPRCVALLEGGYNLRVTAACAEATLRGLLREEPTALADARMKASTERVLRAVVKQQEQYWPVLGTPEHGVAMTELLSASQMASLKLRSSPRTPAPAPRKKQEATPLTV
jgi:acetoin utilization deacetylase AcuC-like enzyme